MSSTTTAGAPAHDRVPNRWVLLAGGVLVQLAIGAIYAWSVFAKALQSDASTLHLSKTQASLPFEVAIAMIFVASYLGGRLQDRRGPRTVALVGVVLYAAGIILSSFARGADQLWLLILGYGVISGFGLGMAYIVPIAMLQKWFPDKAGLITGLAVGGFGFGSVITAPLATSMIANDKAHPTAPFLWLGLAYLVAGVLGASTFRNPPAGWSPVGTPMRSVGPAAATTDAVTEFTPGQALRTPQWYLLTLILTLSVTAGISLVSAAAASASDVAGYTTAGAAALVGVMGLFNGAGRIAWATASDRIGKMPAFVGILALQGLALLALPHASSPVLFAVLAAVVYTCYGGGFGTMPSTAGQFFGTRHAGGIYGLMLVAWSIGGVAGPLLVAALVGDHKNYTLAFTTVGIISLVGAALPFVTRSPRQVLPRI